METKRYNQLKEVIVKSCPDIMELKFGCKVGSREANDEPVAIIRKNDILSGLYLTDRGWNIDPTLYEILGRDITLPDVLITLDKHGIYSEVSSQGQIDASTNTGIDIAPWDFAKNLNGQSDETLEFFYTLLVKSIQ